MGGINMLQLMYSSRRSIPQLGDELASILFSSRRNNALDGVSGLLWTDGTNFLQLLEGDTAAVEDTFARISADPRHDSISVMLRGKIEKRRFPSWSMALFGDSDERLDRSLEHADPSVRAAFEEAASR